MLGHTHWVKQTTDYVVDMISLALDKKEAASALLEGLDVLQKRWGCKPKVSRKCFKRIMQAAKDKDRQEDWGYDWINQAMSNSMQANRRWDMTENLVEHQRFKIMWRAAMKKAFKGFKVTG